MYISKKDLLDTIDELNINKKQILPILSAFSFIGIIITLIAVIPILVVWILLLIAYLPFYYVDLFIAKQIQKRIRNGKYN